jgi:hypothetical protein
MSTSTRIAGFVVVLTVLFGAAFGIGKAFDDEPVARQESYTLVLERTSADASAQAPVRFTVRDGEDRAVTRFAVRHEKRLHLIAVRDDFSGFQHVHPTMAADGTWTTDLRLLGGGYRLFADFQAEGDDEAVAHADLRVQASPGASLPPPPRATRTTTVDGYEVSLAGDLVAGAGTMLTLMVSKDGEEVTDLQPYLGAYGHLVVLRGTDKEYLHAHPEEGPAGPEIPFHVEAPSSGRYYLYLDFKHGDRVRTATFALDTTGAPDDGGDDHGGH